MTDTTFTGVGPDAARAFAQRWLPSWTGGDAEELLGFYAPDALYRDPHVVDGLRGRDAIGGYFRVLLARNPDWVWTQQRSEPLPGGFLNHWHARIPVGDTAVDCEGVCTVILDLDGRIVRNEVFFDTSPLARLASGGDR